MLDRPLACPACAGAVLIRSGHACGRQRWRCKGCGRQFTRTEPRGKPVTMKLEAVGLYCTGLSLNAIGKRLGVSTQSVMRWVRDHAKAHCPKPGPQARALVVEIDEMWHFVEGSIRVGCCGRPCGGQEPGSRGAWLGRPLERSSPTEIVRQVARRDAVEAAHPALQPAVVGVHVLDVEGAVAHPNPGRD